jgi:hypothetical protein
VRDRPFYYTIIASHDTWKQAAIAGGLLATGPFVYFLRNRPA